MNEQQEITTLIMFILLCLLLALAVITSMNSNRKVITCEEGYFTCLENLEEDNESCN